MPTISPSLFTIGPPTQAEDIFPVKTIVSIPPGFL